MQEQYFLLRTSGEIEAHWSEISGVREENSPRIPNPTVEPDEAFSGISSEIRCDRAEPGGWHVVYVLSDDESKGVERVVRSREAIFVLIVSLYGQALKEYRLRRARLVSRHCEYIMRKRYANNQRRNEIKRTITLGRTGSVPRRDMRQMSEKEQSTLGHALLRHLSPT